jgi:glycosyltransferase involved in cell wall biosynthesis
MIHAHNTFWAGYAAFNIGKKYRIPYVVTEHSSRFLINGITNRMLPYAKKVLASAETAIGVSRAVSSILEKLGAKNPSIIPNVVDTDFFSLPPSGRQSQPFTFVAIGNMNYNKGFHVLIRAFSKQFRGRPDVRLVFGGDGPQRVEFQALTCDLGLSEQVTFLGAVGRMEVREALWGANALILPSFRETFGVVLIEALSTGIPVIATKCGGPEDIVTSEVGFIIEPGDEAGLSNAMARLMKTSFLGDDLRSQAVGCFSEEIVVSRIKKIYEHIFDSHRKLFIN